MNSITKGLLAAISLAALPIASQAIVFNTVSSTAGNVTLSSQNVAGHLFTVTSPIIVSDVGFFDADGNGTTGTATVELFKAGAGGLVDPFTGSSSLGSFSVLAGASTAGYVYTTTGGLNLSPGVYGIYASAASNADLIARDIDLPTFSSTSLSYGGDIQNFVVGVGSKYKVVNFVYAVPEPETYAMVAGVGLVAFGLWRRRQ